MTANLDPDARAAVWASARSLEQSAAHFYLGPAESQGWWVTRMRKRVREIMDRLDPGMDAMAGPDPRGEPPAPVPSFGLAPLEWVRVQEAPGVLLAAGDFETRPGAWAIHPGLADFAATWNASHVDGWSIRGAPTLEAAKAQVEAERHRRFAEVVRIMDLPPGPPETHEVPMWAWDWFRRLTYAELEAITERRADAAMAAGDEAARRRRDHLTPRPQHRNARR